MQLWKKNCHSTELFESLFDIHIEYFAKYFSNIIIDVHNNSNKSADGASIKLDKNDDLLLRDLLEEMSFSKHFCFKISKARIILSQVLQQDIYIYNCYYPLIISRNNIISI